jgi:hypothetical protein
MKIQLIDYQHGKTPKLISGSESEVEDTLRQMYPGFGLGVAYGDLFTLCKELLRSHYIFIKFLDQKPQPKPHLNGQAPMVPEEDPWLRESDFPQQSVSPREDVEPENWD